MKHVVGNFSTNNQYCVLSADDPCKFDVSSFFVSTPSWQVPAPSLPTFEARNDDDF